MDHLLWFNERRLNICYAIGAGVCKKPFPYINFFLFIKFTKAKQFDQFQMGS